MSRLIVKNLPKQINEEEIRKHFGKQGNITDIKLKYKNGEFRRFGFIGFENDTVANAACEHLNNTFIKQARITVEVCQEIGSDKKPVSWSEKNKGKQNKKTASLNTNEGVENQEKKKKKKKKKSKQKEEQPVEYKDDPEFGDFLKAGEKGAKEHAAQTGGRNTTRICTKNEEEDTDEEESNENEVKIAKKKDLSDQDYLKSLMKSQPKDKGDIDGKKKKKQKVWMEYFTVVIRAHGMCKGGGQEQGRVVRTFTKPGVKSFLRPLKYRSLRIPRKVRLVAYVGFKTEKEMNQALQKDRSFLDGVRVQVMKYQKPVKESGEGLGSTAPWSAAEEKLKAAEPVGESGKLFVRNLWYSVTEDLLRELFGKYGEVSDVDLPLCKHTRRPKGFATITFLFPEHAVAAMTGLDGTDFKGRVLHILPAITHEEDDAKKGPQSFKEKKAAEQKATAGSWHNWNTLFMGSSAVVDLMAEKYNRSKQEILDSEGKQSLAVNLALGETQLVDETKRFLEEAGVSLVAFTSTGVQRSRTVLLVKNLPAATTAQELAQLFGHYGELGRLILPPSGITGLVEFQDAGEAKRAFKNLAYSRFKYLPLYLEWAPLAVFNSECPPSQHFKGAQKKEEEDAKEEGEEKENKTEKKNEEEEGMASSLPAPEANTTVYVKNLNFATTEDVLKQHFERAGPVHSVLIARRRELSQGYGFVQFLHTRHAQQALRDMNQSVLEEHTLVIKLSEKTLATQTKSARRMHDAGKQLSTKILVKNVPFQATNKEVRQLFATFGELKSVRLPSKPGSSEHRGFGFIDFVSKKDAKKAFDALSLSTHLYDRRLVLEWAKEEETVEELRKKTAQHFLASGPPNKKARVHLTSMKNGGDSNDD